MTTKNNKNLSKRLNILQINNYSYPKGGAEIHFLDLIKLLKSKGHNVVSFSVDSKKRHFLNFSAARRLQKLLEKNKIDLAHVHNINHHLSPLVLKVLKRNKIPVAMTVHDYSLISPNYNLYLKNKFNLKNIILTIEFYLKKILFPYNRLINVFIAPSKFIKNKLKSKGFENVLMLHNFTRTINNKPNIGNYFLYFGRLSEEKGLEIFIKNLVKIKKDFLFYIVGRGPQERKLKKITKDLKLESKIKFLDYKDREKDLSELISNAQFVVVPSLCQENCSLSILESMAHGKIILAPNLGGNPELINSQNGFLYNPYNKTDLLDKINYLIENKESNLKIGEKAQIDIQGIFDSETYYQKLIKIYKDLIN